MIIFRSTLSTKANQQLGRLNFTCVHQVNGIQCMFYMTKIQCSTDVSWRHVPVERTKFLLYKLQSWLWPWLKNRRYKSFIWKNNLYFDPRWVFIYLLPHVAVATVSYLQKSISLSASVWFILDLNSNPIGPGLQCQGCRSGNWQAFEILIKLVLSCTVDFI